MSHEILRLNPPAERMRIYYVDLGTLVNVVPTLHLDSQSVPPGRAFATYQATLPFYTLTLGQGVTEENFSFNATAWMFDDIVLSRTRASAVDVSRTLDHIRADGVDNFSFFSFTTGGWIGDFGGEPVTVGAGQMVGFDLSKPFEASSTDHSALALAVARTSLVKQFRDVPDLHGRILQGMGAEMLLDHMLSLERRIPTMTANDIATVAKATLGIVNALLTAIPSRVDVEPGALKFQHDIRRLIENNLHRPDLSPEWISQETQTARSTLFRSFKSLGGVAAYIQRRRLEVIRSLLLDPEETRSLNELAKTFGFSNPSHFAAAFKRAFGRSPREMRNLMVHSTPIEKSVEGPEVPGAYREWKRKLILR